MFRKPDAEDRPTVVCVGTLKSFGELKASQRSDYSYAKVEIAGAHGCPNARTQFLFLPEFFDPNFNLKTFGTNDADVRKSRTFVYKKNVAASETPSLLEGLCATPEAYDALGAELAELPVYDAENVHTTISRFLGRLGPQLFGYVLRQERRKDGVTVDEGGEQHNNYVKTPYYEPTEFYQVTERAVKGLANRVARNAERRAKAEAAGKELPTELLFKYDPRDLGFDVEVVQATPQWVAA